MIILDGVDDVEFDGLIDYLPSESNVIVTTQNSNLDPDEFNIIPVGDFTEDEAINFMLANTSSRVYSESDIDEVRELISLMEYYPLALEYSRAYINKHRVLQISIELVGYVLASSS